jgi:hypothetical protein
VQQTRKEGKVGDDKMTAQEFERKYHASLPKIIHKMLKRNDGREVKSNCWNTARKIVGSKIPYRWEHDKRMCTWLDKYCVRISPGEIRRGDILTFWYPDGEIGNAPDLTHAAYYLDNGWFFHKDGDYLFEFATLEDIQHGHGDYYADNRLVWYRYVGLDKNREP